MEARLNVRVRVRDVCASDCSVEPHRAGGSIATTSTPAMSEGRSTTTSIKHDTASMQDDHVVSGWGRQQVAESCQHSIVQYGRKIVLTFHRPIRRAGCIWLIGTVRSKLSAHRLLLGKVSLGHCKLGLSSTLSPNAHSLLPFLPLSRGSFNCAFIQFVGSYHSSLSVTDSSAAKLAHFTITPHTATEHTTAHTAQHTLYTAFSCITSVHQHIHVPHTARIPHSDFSFHHSSHTYITQHNPRTCSTSILTLSLSRLHSFVVFTLDRYAHVAPHHYITSQHSTDVTQRASLPLLHSPSPLLLPLDP